MGSALAWAGGCTICCALIRLYMYQLLPSCTYAPPDGIYCTPVWGEVHFFHRPATRRENVREFRVAFTSFGDNRAPRTRNAADSMEKHAPESNRATMWLSPSQWHRLVPPPSKGGTYIVVSGVWRPNSDSSMACSARDQMVRVGLRGRAVLYNTATYVTHYVT